MSKLSKCNESQEPVKSVTIFGATEQIAEEAKSVSIICIKRWFKKAGFWKRKKTDCLNDASDQIIDELVA